MGQAEDQFRYRRVLKSLAYNPGIMPLF